MFTNRKNEYIGMAKTMNCGLQATIIAYRNFKDMDVQFENGIVRTHVSTDNFNRGSISPNARRKPTSKYIGMTKMMNCGMKATIIKCNSLHDIDVQFEDGTIRRHRNMYNFENGSIGKGTVYHDKYVGMTKTMNCGMKATVIKYINAKNINAKNIDVQFEDGTIRRHTDICNFNNGGILPQPTNLAYKHIGTTKLMSCGIKATVIEYRNSKDVDIQFEDGSVKQHMTIYRFNTGYVPHPHKGLIFNKYQIQKPAFMFEDTTYFYVSYKENEFPVSDIMSIEMMKNHLENSQKNFALQTVDAY